MAEPQTSTTEATARRYFDAWTSGNSATVAALLAADFTFAAGDVSIEGRDAFLNAGAFPPDARTTLIAEAYQGDTAFQMYDATRGPHTVRIVEYLRVRDGAIQSVYHGRKRTAISEYGERQFRTKSYTDFGRSRTVVSADAEHPFRLMPNSPGG